MKPSLKQHAVMLDRLIVEAETVSSMLTHLILKLSFKEQDANKAEEALGTCLETLTFLRFQRAVLPAPTSC